MAKETDKKICCRIVVVVVVGGGGGSNVVNKTGPKIEKKPIC